jgi:hypothetical protein
MFRASAARHVIATLSPPRLTRHRPVCHLVPSPTTAPVPRAHLPYPTAAKPTDDISTPRHINLTILTPQETVAACKHITRYNIVLLPITVAARSKAWVCVRSLAGIAGSNTAGGMDVCLL